MSMDGKPALLEAAKAFSDVRDDLHLYVKAHPDFVASGAKLYGPNILTENMPKIVGLFDTSGYADFLRDANIRTVIDLGAADGDLAFTFALAGYQSTYVDMSNPYEVGPLVAKIINSRLSSNVCVIDFDLDRHFDAQSLARHTINQGEFMHKQNGPDYDLVICLGLFYHIKNSYAFLESIAKMSRFCILGTQMMSYLPGNKIYVSETSVSYLLGPKELANDPSNYWVYTDAALRKIISRAGFSILSSQRHFDRQDHMSNPSEPGYREREFLFLKSGMHA